MGRLPAIRASAHMLLLVGSVVTRSSPSWAYTPTVTVQGAHVTWRGDARLNLAGNPANRTGLSDQSFRDAVVRGLQRWMLASGGSVKFDYWQGRDGGIYEPNSNYNGLSSIYFASREGAGSLPSNVLGLTQVWFNGESGEILEADIVLNDNDFRFTTNPSDTSGYGSGHQSYSGGVPSVFIENVVSHELGHAFGLSHSGGLQSTMLFMESPEQAHLGCDERTGIGAIYHAPSSELRGNLRGTVVGTGGATVFGAHVLAISRRRGVVMGSALTNAEGRFDIGALEQGAYFAMVEPFLAGPSALPSYYSGMTRSGCGGTAFGRTMLLESRSRPAALEVSAGHSTLAPQINVVCGGTSAASMAPGAGALVAYEGGPGFGIVDRLSSTNGGATYRLDNLEGDVEIHALGYSLYSPIKPSLELFNAYGGRVRLSTDESEVYRGDSGYVNHDSRISARDLPRGDYTLRVSASALRSDVYPAGPIMLDSVPFVVITGSVNEGEAPLASIVPDNGRCTEIDESGFAEYRSPPGNPPRRSTDEQEDSGGFCGTIGPAGRGGGGSGPMSGGALVGFFLPWTVMALTLQALRRRLRHSRVGR